MAPPAPLNVSIALCTYNGEAHLPTQWQSLLEQHRLPDEVVVFDDCSTDNTVSMLRRFAAEAPFPVRITVNAGQVGFNRNFEQALAACTGDLIFICDQDDCWFPEKLAIMTAVMQEHPHAQLAFCDAWVTDEDLRERQGRFWNWIRFDETAQLRWQNGEMMDVMLDGNRVMGCASVVRREFLTQVLPFPNTVPGYIYDGWLGLVAAAQNAVRFVNQPLQLYRTHVRQQVGVRSTETRERIRLFDRLARHRAKKLAPLLNTQEQLTAIHKLLSERVPPDAPGLPQLHRRLNHFTLRSHLPPQRLRRLWPILSSLRQGNYQRYADASANWYAPYLAALGDWLE